MAIYHLNAKVVDRSSSRSSVGSSAYISGTKIKNERDGVTHDYSRKNGVAYSEVMLCDNAPSEWQDRNKLWNEVEKIENGNGQPCRIYEVALPNELTREEQISLVQEYTYTNFVLEGMCADFSIHDKGDGNPHAHIMLTTRPIDENGKWENKSQKVYLCKNAKGEEKAFTADELKQAQGFEKQLPYYKNGNPSAKPVKITKYEKEHNKKYDSYERVKGKNDPKKLKEDKKNPKCEQWNSKEHFNNARESWAETTNLYLEQKGLDERIDHRSYAEQGVEKIPTNHLGVSTNQMEKRGIETDRGNINREIKISNQQVHDLNSQIKNLNAEHIEVQTDMQIQKFHNQIQIIKSSISVANKEQIEGVERAIPIMENYMKEIKNSNFKGTSTVIVGDKQYPYRDYHVDKFEKGIGEVKLMTEERKQQLLTKINENLKEYKEIAKQQNVVQDTENQSSVVTSRTVDLQAVAKDLEDNRREYIEVITRLKESELVANKPRVTNQYLSQYNQISESINNIQKFDVIIAQAQTQKDSLGVFKGAEKKKLQETIDRGQENKQQQIVKLKELGVDNISKAPIVLNKLKVQHETEQQTVTDFNKGKKVLQERAEQLKTSYKEKKSDFTTEQIGTVDGYQKQFRKADKSKEQHQYMDLSKTQAEIQADRDLETKKQDPKTHDRNQTHNSHEAR